MCSRIPLGFFIEDGAEFDHCRTRHLLQNSASTGCPLCYIIQAADEETHTWSPVDRRLVGGDMRFFGMWSGPFRLKMQMGENESIKLFVSSSGRFPVHEAF